MKVQKTIIAVLIMGGFFLSAYQEPPPNQCKGWVIHGVEFIQCTQNKDVCISKKEFLQLKKKFVEWTCKCPKNNSTTKGRK